MVHMVIGNVAVGLWSREQRDIPPIASEAEPLHTVLVCPSFALVQTVWLVNLEPPQKVHRPLFAMGIIEVVLAHHVPGLHYSA